MSYNNLKNAVAPLLVGVGAASFWRGAWYILDDQLFPTQPLYSCLSSLGLGVVSTLVFQPLVTLDKTYNLPGTTTPLQTVSKTQWYSPIRTQQAKTFLGIYGLAWSCVLVWRGTWMGWDLFYEYIMTSPHKLFHADSWKNDFLRAMEQINQTIRSTWMEGSYTSSSSNSSTLMMTLEDVMEGTRDGFFSNPCLLQANKEKEEENNKTTPPLEPDPMMIHHGTLSGLASHLTAIFFLSSFGILASVFAPPARIAVLQDVRFTWMKWWR